MAEILPEVETFARIKVIGVGGGGTSAVERMIKSKVQGIEFVAVNTDAQALHYSHAPHKVHIGHDTTRGLGAGADPEVGRRAAEESESEIYEMLKGADMVFITCGMGGGTGTGAAPLIAAAARESGILTVGIVTRPFTFEGERRRRSAEHGIQELKDNVDTLITIPNDRLLHMIDRKTSLLDAFSVVDEVLQQGVQGISDLITIHGLINLDFADVKAIMSNAGSALMGIGRASGENRAIEAARQAIDSPLLEVSVDGAKGVLFNITGSRNMSMHEIDEAAKTITAAVDPEANIIFGAVLDETLDDEIKVTVVATGFDSPRSEPIREQPRVVQERPERLAPEAVPSYSRPEPAAPRFETTASRYEAPATPRYESPTPASRFEPSVPLTRESAFAQDDVARPVMPEVRKPFIDERPRSIEAEAQEREDFLADLDPEPKRRAESRFSFEPARPVAGRSATRTVASIEPDPEEIPDRIDTKSEMAASKVETPAYAADPKDSDEDDLDIPAFIRRKVE